MNRPSARARRNSPASVMQLYERYLAEEMGAKVVHIDRKQEDGRPKGARRRAVERVAEELGYSNWRSAYSAVLRWESTHCARLETFGLELDPEFSRRLRKMQDAIDLALQGCDAMRACEGFDAGTTASIRQMLIGERPGYLCPWCKVIVPDCDECDGDGWFDSLAGMDIDGRLEDPKDIHVCVDGVVMTLDAYEEGTP